MEEDAEPIFVDALKFRENTQESEWDHRQPDGSSGWQLPGPYEGKDTDPTLAVNSLMVMMPPNLDVTGDVDSLLRRVRELLRASHATLLADLAKLSQGDHCGNPAAREFPRQLSPRDFPRQLSPATDISKSLVASKTIDLGQKLVTMCHHMSDGSSPSSKAAEERRKPAMKKMPTRMQILTNIANHSTPSHPSHPPRMKSKTTSVGSDACVLYGFQSGMSVDGSNAESDGSCDREFARGGTSKMVEHLSDRMPTMPEFSSQSLPSQSSAKDIRRKSVIRTKASTEVGLAAVVTGSRFELVFATLIVFNTIALCLEAQYLGYETAYEIKFRGASVPAAEAWPYADVIFKILEFAFGVAFTCEVAMKLFILRRRFVESFWNLFDGLIIVLWVLSSISQADINMNPMLLRLLRLGRLLRLLRFVRAFQVFDVLWLLVESIRACASVLIWSICLLFMCMVSCALVFTFSLEPEIRDPSRSPESQAQLFLYFGSFSRALLSMYEITMGNYAPIARELHENVTEWFMPIILLYRCLVSFALMKVISGIFLHETLRTAASNDDVMIMQKDRQIRNHLKKMTQLFKEADESGDGELSLDEFQNVMTDPRVRTWLAAQELEISDVELLFNLLDTGRGVLSAEELVVGFARLKGPARSLDMLTLLHLLEGMERSVAALRKEVL
eukprot:TRINITY_DN65249_c0_g1_i1.p1 TRINITY_DN65249_c0_g1~~TRINITY_DN65249_c0_g1_i1.p1  ORF type:complete len:673 (-),score=140.40 TRINITY_DN65249_c0_g1_i1:152-2170(-)